MRILWFRFRKSANIYFLSKCRSDSLNSGGESHSVAFYSSFWLFVCFKSPSLKVIIFESIVEVSSTSSPLFGRDSGGTRSSNRSTVPRRFSFILFNNTVRFVPLYHPCFPHQAFVPRSLKFLAVTDEMFLAESCVSCVTTCAEIRPEFPEDMFPDLRKNLRIKEEGEL